MTERVTPKAENEVPDLLNALLYGDVFDCAVTLDEVWQYARVAIDRDELSRLLREDRILRLTVIERNGFYCLHNREALLARRPSRVLRAHRLQKRARWVARALCHLPFVRGLILTGSASADDATAEADVDLLVIVAVGRMGTAFLLLAPLSRLLGRQLFCPNWYMSEDRLAIAPGSLYIAREFAQARSLSGKGDDLRDANPWIADYFPNAVAPAPLASDLKKSSRLQRLLEAPLRGTLGDLLERQARRIAARRLQAHYHGFGLEVPAEVEARFEDGVALGFHGFRYEQSTLKAHAARRAQLLKQLTPH
jgi:predicted nucleotidyltransferase